MTLTKTIVAKAMGISRSGVYYYPIQPIKDLIVKQSIEKSLSRHKTYGHRRIANELKRGKNSILRVMKKFNLQPLMRKKKRSRKKADENKENSRFPNIVENIPTVRPNQVWAADFTYILFHGSFAYLATTIDLFTREVVGWTIQTRHNAELVCSAMIMALGKREKPAISHSDQGSEYRSKTHIKLLETNDILVSMSRKASPWENPFQEAFYSQFKLDFGDPNRFETLGELIEAIGQQIRDYNEGRIHSALAMAPAEFRRQFEAKQLENKQTKSMTLISETQRSTIRIFSDLVCQKTGA